MKLCSRNPGSLSAYIGHNRDTPAADPQGMHEISTAGPGTVMHKQQDAGHYISIITLSQTRMFL